MSFLHVKTYPSPFQIERYLITIQETEAKIAASARKIKSTKVSQVNVGLKVTDLTGGL